MKIRSALIVGIAAVGTVVAGAVPAGAVAPQAVSPRPATAGAVTPQTANSRAMIADQTTPPEYYLALGDSLARGFQPGLGDTNMGYTDALYATLRVGHPSLQLVKLGCSGETTTTMISGGICSYPGTGSQLAAARAFLQAHGRQVRYVTLDIGANDVDGCASSGTLDLTCVRQGLTTIAGNLPRILATLRTAGGFRASWAAMTYYDPFLAAWLTGPAGQATARESVQVVNVLNGLERFDYTIFGFRVADVSAAFHTQDFTTQVTLPGFGLVPLNVATICALTYMCTLQNIHPTVTGYQVIAQTFAAVLEPRSAVAAR
jgi:lysophospholipase L1-like esterase